MLENTLASYSNSTTFDFMALFNLFYVMAEILNKCEHTNLAKNTNANYAFLSYEFLRFVKIHFNHFIQ